MNLPVQKPEVIQTIQTFLREALSPSIQHVLINPQAYIVIYPSAEAVIREKPDFESIKKLGGRRVAITALNDQPDVWGSADIVSRYFTPSMGINEDPVTGSIHTSLIPYWQAYLNKQVITAYQASSRGGWLSCELVGEDRIEISGYCKLYLEGEIYLSE